MAVNERADSSAWFFLTGTPDAVRRVIVEGYKIGIVDETRPNAAIASISHNDMFALQGPDGVVYDYVHDDDFNLNAMVAKVRVLRGKKIA